MRRKVTRKETNGISWWAKLKREPPWSHLDKKSGVSTMHDDSRSRYSCKRPDVAGDQGGAPNWVNLTLGTAAVLGSAASLVLTSEGKSGNRLGIDFPGQCARSARPPPRIAWER